MPTLLCVPILVDDPAEAAADARAARDAGADVVEFRVDPFFSGNEGPDFQDEALAIAKLVRESPLPCIVTCRPTLEGGHYAGPDSARVALFESLAASADADAPPAYLDVELATYTRSANLKQKVNLVVDHPGQQRAVDTRLILSAHDFNSRPPDLLRRFETMLREPACRVAKIAYRARSLRDNLEVLDIARASAAASPAENAPAESALDDAPGAEPPGDPRPAAGKPAIALCMGPFGLMSRVLAPKFDAFLTFASLSRDSATAPGQPVIGELLGVYRFRSIGPATRVYGVVGWPVEHSLSPLVHNAGFDALGFDGVYLPMPVPPEFEHFKATVLAMADHPHLDLSGLSVTVPHKEHLVRLARERMAEGDSRWTLDDLSAATGSANTLRIGRDPRGRPAAFFVANTDGPAVVSALSPATGQVAGRPVLVLGAGGTARAAAGALALAGAAVHVLNRTPARAAELCADVNLALARTLGPSPAGSPRLRVAPAAPDELAALAPAAVVNATSAGMAGSAEAGRSPLSAEQLAALPAGTVVLDAVYRPLQTPLLGAARDRALVTIDGVRMFVAQAAAQFALWTGAAAPGQLFDRVVRETLRDSPEA